MKKIILLIVILLLFILCMNFSMWIEMQNLFEVLKVDTENINIEVKNYATKNTLQLKGIDSKLETALKATKVEVWKLNYNPPISDEDHAYRMEFWNEEFHAIVVVSENKLINSVYFSGRQIPINVNRELLAYLDSLFAQNL